MPTLQGFTGLPYHPGRVLLLDVRCLVPGSSTAAPAGWACLPVFEAAGPCVASGVYHLPLFQVRGTAGNDVLSLTALNKRQLSTPEQAPTPARLAGCG